MVTKEMICPEGRDSHCVGCQHRGRHDFVEGCLKKGAKSKCPICVSSEYPIESLNPSIWHPEELEQIPGGAINVPMRRIRPPANAIRKDYEPIDTLIASIKRRGVLQPLGIRPLDPEWREFEPVIGCRRHFACSQLKLEKVPCYIKPSLNADDIAAIALEENSFRKNLHRKEVAKAISILVKEGHSESDIASTSGMNIRNARAYIRLPNLPEQIKSAFWQKKIGIGHLFLLSELKTDAARLKLLEKIESEQLSEAAVKQLLKLGKIQMAEVPERVRALFGKNLFIGERSGGRGVFLKISADDKQELCQILRRVIRSIKGLCAMTWHGKIGRPKEE